MKRRMYTVRPRNCNVWASIAKPADPTLGQRIREAVLHQSPLETAHPPIFDEEVNKPTHNMDCDPLRDFGRDAFDKAMTVLDNLGSKADLGRLSKDMKPTSNEEKAADSKAESTE